MTDSSAGSGTLSKTISWNTAGDTPRATSKDVAIHSNASLNVPHVNRPHSSDTISELSVYGGDIWPERVATQSPSNVEVAAFSRNHNGFRARLHAIWVSNKGLILVFLAQLFGGLMNVTTRMLELEGNNGKGMHPFQILLARMSITFFLASCYMWYANIPHFPFGAKGVRVLLFARGFGGLGGVYGLYHSLQYLPLADATVITFLGPPLSCWACSYLLKEPFTNMEQIATLISLFGVVLIARPTAFFASTPESINHANTYVNGSMTTNRTVVSQDDDTIHHVTPEQRLEAVAFAMLGVFGAASAFTTIRWIGKRAHPLISVNYFAAWCTIVSATAIATLPSVPFVLPANVKEWGYLIFLGICGFIMQYLLSAGLAAEKSSRATNMVYTQMLFALTFDKLIFGTNPGVLSIIGSSLILGSAIYVAVRKGSAPSADESKSLEAETGLRDEEQGLVQGMESTADDDTFSDDESIEMQSLRT